MSNHKILDWKGNEVKAGMTIYFVQTKPGILEAARHGLLMPSNGEIIWENKEDWEKRNTTEIWQLGKPYLVEQLGGGLCLTTEPDEDDHVFSFPLSYAKDSTLAIKGLSDQREVSM